MFPRAGGACHAEPTSQDPLGHGGRGLLESSEESGRGRSLPTAHLRKDGPPDSDPAQASS